MKNPIKASRIKWEEVLRGNLEQHLDSKQNPKIGLIGALGANDVGDEAMLVALMDRLKDWFPGAKLTIYSNRPRLTNFYLNIETEPTLYGLLNNPKTLLSWFCHGINEIENIITVFLQKIFKPRKTWCGKWFFRLCYLFIAQYIYHLARLVAEGRKIEPRGLISKHLLSLQQLDALIFIGGGYLNSWHVKAGIYPYLITAKAAMILSKPVFASGFNLGPLNAFDKRYAGKIIKDFKLIGVRDNNESVQILKDMGCDDRKYHFSSDDAVTLDCSDMGNGALRNFALEHRPYLALQAHKWLLGAEDKEFLVKSLAAAIDNIIKKFNLQIVLIPMQFAEESISGVESSVETKKKKILTAHGLFLRRLKGKRVADSVILEEIRERSLHKEKIFMAPKQLLPQQLKYLFANARVALCTRHHSAVFSLSEGIPAVVVELDEYYKMKLLGFARESLDKCRIVPLHSENLKELLYDSVVFLLRE